ncbi:MOSC domain-containing protein [Ornithinimicrobium tianjinense]|uniref:Molybdenum cofactor biosysynthesis protein n=1 Tax=Ornithinimicrobium tianjinense TaxID=1195761 RepID=A0A917F3U5_9MICO|nr:MOSC domain-containing protein [Ornithinimicrobium tianjinense]GGF42773.1 molybdenum cofactor biosysynthesis protein [Ornithinimicrobium tianjinense]
MTPHVRSVNLARPKPEPGGKGYRTGIDKRPVGSIEVFEPGPRYGDGPGVVGDHVGDVDHHGGAHKAVYAFAREELDRWEAELQRGLPDGGFGENLTTEGIDLEALLINQRLRVGEEVVLEVSVPRTPCATFAGHMGEKGWVRRFAERGRCGVYLRVAVPGTVHSGDTLELLEPPAHDVDMLTAFAAAMGDDEAARRVVDARCLPTMYHERLVRRLTARP